MQSRTALTYRINSYFAILLVTIAGSGAAMLIIHVASASEVSVTFLGSEAPYLQLQAQP